MLRFDVKHVPEFSEIDKNTAKRQFLFNINGQVHGQPVFSEVIFYMMKGGKLVNCLLGKINEELISDVDAYRQTGVQKQTHFPTRFECKIKDLPKSFGCEVDLHVDQNNRQFQQLNKRLFQILHDQTGQFR